MNNSPHIGGVAIPRTGTKTNLRSRGRGGRVETQSETVNHAEHLDLPGSEKPDIELNLTLHAVLPCLGSVDRLRLGQDFDWRGSRRAGSGHAGGCGRALIISEAAAADLAITLTTPAAARTARIAESSRRYDAGFSSDVS